MKQLALNVVKKLKRCTITFNNIILPMKTRNITAQFVTRDSLINMLEMTILIFTLVRGHISVNIAQQHLQVMAPWAHIKEPIWA